MNISNIRPPLNPAEISGPQAGDKVSSNSNATSTPGAPASPGLSFDRMLQSLEKTQVDSDVLIQKLAAGEEVELHQVMLASEQADLSMRVALAIRDKLVDAYREVMRMNV